MQRTTTVLLSTFVTYFFFVLIIFTFSVRYRIAAQDGVLLSCNQKSNERGLSFERNCVLRLWESETLK